ncbi:hypothetical protein Patl1_24209 [Pistacia atlantica]|uniref:Uncharacterized protein n=1 Tax=Pistacia atlantica TaxID=434234 RepID=A0ACC0ZYK4_9ROSI|nr:hypothetical protein Patl1_24209 [Pistacia atlantica]
MKLPTNTTIGTQILESRGLNLDEYYFLVALGALFDFTLLFNIGFILALSFLKFPGSSRAMISQEKFVKFQGSQDSNDSKLVEEKSKNSPMKDGFNFLLSFQIFLTGGMVLPLEPLSVAFQDMKYYVDIHGEKKFQLLSNFTYALRPGILSALMGVSRDGKSTLLDVLAGRKSTGYIEGEIKIGGYPKVQEPFARVSVGVPGIRGLSTEQRKRLTIAAELVANPSIILMDEPTSGLDARAAAVVMRAVKNLVETGRTIVCTIHQLSIDIFEAFDEINSKIFLLSFPNVTRFVLM